MSFIHSLRRSSGATERELEDGEIDDRIGTEELPKDAAEVTEDKEREKEKVKSHRHSQKRSKKNRDKKKSKRRRKHHSPSSSSSSDSYDSDFDRPKSRRRRDYDGQSSQDKNSVYPKKHPIMSKEFINRHTVVHKGTLICKYFPEGRCFKGPRCKFEHKLIPLVKKKELCKFYFRGYCSKGDNCSYMHNEYPCKFFHTGAKCYKGEKCKFSHDALNEVTKELLSKVQPTVDLVQKIALGGSCSYQDNGTEQFTGGPEDMQTGMPLDGAPAPGPPASVGPCVGLMQQKLRYRAALIPLDPNPGVVLRDPRCQLKQFSHKVDILLQRPAFAATVVWAPEDLIPSLVPKQEHSINLPLPPLVVNAQMNRSTFPDSHPVSSPPPADPRLAVARIKTQVPSGSVESRLPLERQADPRRSLDPRLKRTSSLDSKMLGQKETPSTGAAVDPRLQKSSGVTLSQTVRPKSEPEKLPPYAPRLFSSGGGLESPTTILGGIGLYDPRNETEQKKQEELPKKSGVLKTPVKRYSTAPPSLSPTQRSSSLDEPKSTETLSDQTSPPPRSATPPPTSPVKPAAVHNLPVQALTGLMRPQYTDPRRAKQVRRSVSGSAPEETMEVEQGKQDTPEEDEDAQRFVQDF